MYSVLSFAAFVLSMDTVCLGMGVFKVVSLWLHDEFDLRRVCCVTPKLRAQRDFSARIIRLGELSLLSF